MFHLRSAAAAVWLLAGAGAHSTGAAWAANAPQTGKLHPWVLVAAFWGVALLSVSVHYLRRYLAQAAVRARRSWHQSAPERARLLARARLTLTQASGSVWRSARQLTRAQTPLARASSLAGQGWDWTRKRPSAPQSSRWLARAGRRGLSSAGRGLR